MTDTDVLDCGPGFYNDLTDGSYCKVCVAGFYCPDALNIHPTPCPKQQYSAEGATYCELCPAGYYCPNEGTSDSDLQNQKCPKGTLCNVEFTGTINGVLLTAVAAGIDTYPNKMSIADGGHACPEYKYCPQGTSTAIDIPIGTMQSTFGRGDLEEAI